jgi:hypothetical protein
LPHANLGHNGHLFRGQDGKSRRVFFFVRLFDHYLVGLGLMPASDIDVNRKSLI